MEDAQEAKEQCTDLQPGWRRALMQDLWTGQVTNKRSEGPNEPPVTPLEKWLKGEEPKCEQTAQDLCLELNGDCSSPPTGKDIGMMYEAGKKRASLETRRNKHHLSTMLRPTNFLERNWTKSSQLKAKPFSLLRPKMVFLSMQNSPPSRVSSLVFCESM